MRAAAASYEFALARFDGAGSLDCGFGGGVVLDEFPGAAIARATALARQADGKLVVAGIACASGRGPQCEGGTARIALARYEITGSPGGPPGSGTPAPASGKLESRFVALPSRLTVRRGKVRVRMRCVQAKRCRGRLALRRLRTGKRSLLLGSRSASIPARRTRTIVVNIQRQRLGSARRIRVRMAFSGRDASGKRREVVKRVSLKRR